MRRSPRAEDGSAALELLTAGVLLLVPLIYLGLALAALQGASLAVEGAAHEAARVYVSSNTDASGRAAAERAVTVALADHRIARETHDLSFSCDGGTDDCLANGHRITVTVHIVRTLPFVPAILGADRLARVPIEARATAPIFRLGGAP